MIRRDGTVETGRPVEIAGAHVKNHNANSVGVCMVGGVNKNNSPESNFTRAQWLSLDSLISRLVSEHPGSKVCGHHDLFAGKACPSFNAIEWWGS